MKFTSYAKTPLNDMRSGKSLLKDKAKVKLASTSPKTAENYNRAFHDLSVAIRKFDEIAASLGVRVRTITFRRLSGDASGVGEARLSAKLWR